MIACPRAFTGILAPLAILLLLGSCAPEPRSGDEPPTPSEPNFSDRDRELIRQFYSEYEFPPDLAEPEVLTPDLEKRIELYALVPPGPSGTPLPVDLESRLVRLPPGYVRFRVGSDVVLMDSRTREVLDVIRGVLP